MTASSATIERAAKCASSSDRVLARAAGVLAAGASLASLLITPAPAGADGLVPVGHHARPPLRVQVWTDREEEAVYYPGEPVNIHFTTNDGAYVIVYDIDTEGRVRRLFPAPGDPGYVHAHQVVSLPGPHAAFDYIVTGPPGIETIEAVASRVPLLPWEGPEPWGDEGEWEGEGHEEWEEGEEWEGHEDGDYDENWDDGEWEEGIWRSRTEARVSGDPYLAIDHMNRRVLPEACSEGDYATDFVTFCVGRQVSYPRYACNDCHGPYPAFDPYVDACSVFRVEVNVAWFPPPSGVYVVHPVRPRYVYVRREHVPVRYRHLKHEWSGWDRKQIDRELKPMVKAVRRPSYKSDSKLKPAAPRKRDAKIEYGAKRSGGSKVGQPPRVRSEVRAETPKRQGSPRKRDGFDWKPDARRDRGAPAVVRDRPAKEARIDAGRKAERVESSRKSERKGESANKPERVESSRTSERKAENAKKAERVESPRKSERKAEAGKPGKDRGSDRAADRGGDGKKGGGKRGG